MKHDVIKKSHARSVMNGMEEDRLFPRKMLKGSQLEALLEKNQYLIETSLPFIKNLYTLVKGSGFVITLTDGQGCILELTGDAETMRDASLFDMIPGAYMDEDSVGTNAMSLAIDENRPIQLTAQEHFINAYHRWTCSSSPIHNTDDEILGALNLMGKKDQVHSHTLGLVVATVNSIEQQFRNQKLNQDLSETSGFLDAVINNLSYATFTLNTLGYINRVNKTAVKIFDISRSELYGRHISKYLSRWEEIWNTVKAGDKLLDEEVVVHAMPKSGAFVMSAMPILTEDNELNGVVLTFRDMKRVYSMVNKYTGMKAHYTFSDIIGSSDNMKRLIDFAEKISDSPSTVLINGESGTGKEVFAQSIHNASSRRDAGFVAVNCGAIPEALFESELFGYDDGAFTGARKGGKPGKFELANGGTLFLDEVGEMPPDMQVKLLRVLQEEVVTRVGGNKTIPVDVRIIAATNKDLKTLVDEKKFRLDLFYRLSVIPLKIPALRERGEDIRTLIEFFLGTKAFKLKKNIPRLDKEIYQLLMRYEWPGNVRELENFIEKTVNLDGAIMLDVEDEEAFRKKYLNPEAYHPGNELAGPLSTSIRSLAELEKDAIQNALNQLNGNKTQVAKMLGIGRNTLYLKAKQYGITL
ncbi:MAG: PAS domain-containing protein [Bacteroidetes bacterium]|nr:MAG: PAS domain-containing protein [Bacteroidota bacterium]